MYQRREREREFVCVKTVKKKKKKEKEKKGRSDRVEKGRKGGVKSQAREKPILLSQPLMKWPLN